MKNKVFAVCMLLSALVILVGVGCSKETQKLPDISLIGDIYQTSDFIQLFEAAEKKTVKYNDKNLEAVVVSEFIEQLSPVYINYQLYLIANDGFMIKLEKEDLNDTYLAYSDSDGWVFISDKHPVNSRIKDISEIEIVGIKNEPNYDFGLNIIEGQNTFNYSIGELFQKNYSILPVSDGVSSKEYEGEDYSVEVLQNKKVIKVEDLVEGYINTLLLMDGSGEYEYLTSLDGVIELRQNTVNYILPNKHKTYVDLKGIWINPPSTSVMDVYYDTLHYLKNDEKVMVVYIDGFSYLQYERIKNMFPYLNISNYQNVIKANTVYVPVTNSTFASMITGKPPVETGVLNRDYRELKVPTIFDMADQLNKKSVLVEGDIKILNTNIEPILNLDLNQNGYTDDEIYQSALEELSGNYDFMLVHFHGFDEMGHEYGPYSDETLEYIKIMDQYVTDLVGRWDGKVIITADHGMHQTDDAGSHGEFRIEDMLIPYIFIEGGTKD